MKVELNLLKLVRILVDETLSRTEVLTSAKNTSIAGHLVEYMSTPPRLPMMLTKMAQSKPTMRGTRFERRSIHHLALFQEIFGINFTMLPISTSYYSLSFRFVCPVCHEANGSQIFSIPER